MGMLEERREQIRRENAAELGRLIDAGAEVESLKREWWKKYQVNLRAGRIGDWEIERFEIRSDSIENLRLAFQPGGRLVPEGWYTRLVRRWTTVMSDTPDEIRDHLDAIQKAKELRGTCLVNGLGLGVVASAMLAEGAERVIVIEKALKVIELVGTQLNEQLGERLEIRQADALEYRPPRGERYTVVWHDIWDGFCSDNLPEMHILHRRYGRRCDWQGSWGRWRCEDQRRRERAVGW